LVASGIVSFKADVVRTGAGLRRSDANAVSTMQMHVLCGLQQDGSPDSAVLSSSFRLQHSRASGGAGDETCSSPEQEDSGID
jgi:hypothetical protein